MVVLANCTDSHKDLHSAGRQYCSLQFDVISPGVPHMLPSQQAVEPLASPAELLQISPRKTDSASSAILV